MCEFLLPILGGAMETYFCNAVFLKVARFDF